MMHYHRKTRIYSQPHADPIKDCKTLERVAEINWQVFKLI